VGSASGRVFQLADAIDVRLIGVSVRHRGLDLVPAGMSGAPPAERRGHEQHGSRRGRPARR
jgi:hypothetical protein